MSKRKIHYTLTTIFLIIVPALLFWLSASDLIWSHSLADIAIFWGLVVIAGLSISAGLVFLIKAMRQQTKVVDTQAFLPKKINKQISPLLLIVSGIASMTILPLSIAGPLFRSFGINFEFYFLVGGALLIILGFIALFTDL